MKLRTKNKNFISYAMAMAGLLTLMRWLEMRLLIFRHSFEVYAGIIALIFTALGIWVAIKLAKPKTETIIIEKKVPANLEFTRNDAEIKRLNISKRELEVLELMAAGCSNREIAEQLFLSTNTVKTHAANIFEKLDAKRRTQAVENAKQAGLIS